MTKSTITRERLEEIRDCCWMDDLGLSMYELSELARIALDAIDSKPVAYMYRDNLHSDARFSMESKIGNWSPEDINEYEISETPLYRHAQPAPELKPVGYLFVSDQGAIIYSPTDWGMPGFRLVGQIYGDIDVESQPAPVAPVCTCPSGDGSLRWPCPVHPGNSQAIPEGYVMVPMRLTAENGAKGVLSGEFSETKFVNCPECFGDDECETCDGSGRIEIKVPVSWTTIKDIWIKGVEHFAAAPQENI
ncbi:hypothetical protein ACYCBU_18570 [Klebsiella pneumoniae]